jgi:glycosyltransferase involved in cell wall biosynthesis
MRDEAPALHYTLYSSGSISTARFETLWMIVCLWRRVRAVRPDVIFCAGNSYTVVAVALRLLLGLACPPVVAKVSNDLDRPDMNALARLAYRLWLKVQGRLIHHWVAIAGPMREGIARALDIPPERVTVIDNPVLDQAEARRLAEARDRALRDASQGRLFLSVGRLALQKRFDLLLAAFARAGGPDDRLVILGEGPCRGALEALAQRLGIASRLSLPGHESETASWFARADMFLLSSDYEGLPGVVIEAMAAGLPIVATRSSAGMDELLGRGRFGQVVERGDVNALAAAMASPGAEPDRRALRAQAKRFRVERAAPAYLRLLQKAADADHALAAWGNPESVPSTGMNTSGLSNVSD